MGRGKGDLGNYEKYTILFEPKMNEDVERAAAKVRRIKSEYVRDVLQAKALEDLGEPQPNGKKAITLEMSPETAFLLEQAALYTDMTPAAVAQRIINEHVRLYHSQACKEHSERVALMRQIQESAQQIQQEMQQANEESARREQIEIPPEDGKKPRRGKK